MLARLWCLTLLLFATCARCQLLEKEARTRDKRDGQRSNIVMVEEDSKMAMTLANFSRVNITETVHRFLRKKKAKNPPSLAEKLGLRAKDGTKAETTGAQHALDNAEEHLCAKQETECSLSSSIWGVPTLILAQGQSGAEAVFHVLGKLISPDSVSEAVEDLGTKSADLDKFMKVHTKDRHCWLVNLLCDKHRDSVEYFKVHSKTNKTRSNKDVLQPNVWYPIYGSIWRPLMPSFNTTAAIRALGWLKRSPHVKVLLLRRNELDVLIDKATPNTADPFDPIKLSTKTLLKNLGDIQKINDDTEALLEQNEVPFLRIYYEALLYPFSTDGWQTLLDFMGLPPERPLALKGLKKQFAHLAYPKDRDKRLTNYQDVADKLEGTEYEHLLGSN